MGAAGSEEKRVLTNRQELVEDVTLQAILGCRDPQGSEKDMLQARNPSTKLVTGVQRGRGEVRAWTLVVHPMGFP